jgi:hypothetical protein
MNFALGSINVETVGNSDIIKKFGELLQLVKTQGEQPDIIFEFVNELGDWAGEEYVPLDNYEIGDNRVRISEKLFRYELRFGRTPMRVLVCPAKTDVFRHWQRAINKSWRYFHTHGGGGYLHYLKRFVFYVYMPCVELALLKKGATLAHCSAIEKGNRAVLFAAWGGVGKTGIMSRYLSAGWNFLSDDSCVITGKGTAHIHPLPMHIYKYHEKQNKELVGKMLSESGVFDKLLWRGLSLVKKPDKLVRWVSPDKVFGSDRISFKGDISTVIHMHRCIGRDSFKLEAATPDKVSGLMASTILDEINNLANTAIVVNSCNSAGAIPDIGNLHRSIAGIYSSAFSKAECFVLTVPKQASSEDICGFIEDNKLF